MSTANRNARRETARQAAFSFLSNIALGSEADRYVQNGDNDTTDNFVESNSRHYRHNRQTRLHRQSLIIPTTVPELAAPVVPAYRGLPHGIERLT
jgi:hypothetical protein